MQEGLPQISVIVPSYNQGRFIEETFRSLLSQNYPLLEIIVIDGGSTDHSVQVIQNYEQHLAFWVSEKDSGQSEAINKGFRKASGDIITWLNSDDCYEPGALHRVAGFFMEHPGISIAHGKSVLFGKGISEKIIGTDKEIPLHEYFAFMRFPQPSSFFRREALLQALPVNETLHYAMDFDLVVRMLLNGALVKNMPDILSRYRLHADSKSNHQIAFLREWTAVAATFFAAVKGGESYKERLYTLRLIADDISVSGYTTALRFEAHELEQIFLLHLNLCYHTFYQACDKPSCRRISNYLKNHAYAFYVENNYPTYERRLKFIPKFVFKLLRPAR